MTQTPTIGRIVHYQLAADDAAIIAEHRARTAAGDHCNTAHAGDRYPAMIVRVNDTAAWSVNLRVFLDGADDYWCTSREGGPDGATGSLDGRWFWPPRVG